ncbi:hypothetical protein [Serratia sp. (in: enterobacteria)]|uniref:hypothetical protein n=1 Tax=Serratia sp. (in: enterobacteria) TaxID=616 RepID=UPI00398A065A
MAQFGVTVNATSNTTANTEDTFLELAAAANKLIKIKRIRIGFGNGTQTAGVDNHFRVRIVRKSAAGATGVGSTEVARDPTGVATATVATEKNGTTAFSVGTVSDVIDQIAPNGRMLYEFIARDEDDKIVSTAGGILGILIQSPVVSQTFQVTCDWQE